MDFVKGSVAVISLLGTVSSIVTAYLGAFAILLYLKEKRLRKAQYTLEMFDRFRLNEIASFPFTKEVELFNKKVESDGDPEDIRDMPLFARMADLEALGMAIRKDVIDEDMVYEYVGEIVVTTFEETKEFVSYLRSHSDNPAVYSDLEALARRWTIRSQRHAG